MEWTTTQQHRGGRYWHTQPRRRLLQSWSEQKKPGKRWVHTTWRCSHESSRKCSSSIGTERRLVVVRGMKMKGGMVTRRHEGTSEDEGNVDINVVLIRQNWWHWTQATCGTLPWTQQPVGEGLKQVITLLSFNNQLLRWEKRVFF